MNRAIKGLERDCRQGKQVDCCDAIGMVAEKRPPALRWWPPAAAHILSDCRLSDLEAKLERFDHQGASLPRLFAASMPNRIFGTQRYLGSYNLPEMQWEENKEDTP